MDVDRGSLSVRQSSAFKAMPHDGPSEIGCGAANLDGGVRPHYTAAQAHSSGGLSIQYYSSMTFCYCSADLNPPPLRDTLLLNKFICLTSRDGSGLCSYYVKSSDIPASSNPGPWCVK